MKKNKWMHLLLSLLFVMGLAACSSDDGGTTTNENDTPEEEENTDGNEPVTIRMHHWYNEEQDRWHEVVEAFEADHPHIKVETVSPENNDANETMQQIDLAAASGDQLDVIIVNDAANYSQRVAQGMFEPLDEYLDVAGIEYENEYRVNTNVDGHYYALPGKYNMFFVMLNQDALDEAGLDVPTDWTWDEYMDYAAALTEGEGPSKRYGTFFHTWMDYVKLAAFNQPTDSNIIKDDGVTSNVDSDHIRQSLEIRERGHEEGSATPYADTISLDLNYRPQFFGESAAMIMTGSWMINERGGVDDAPEFTVAYAPYPKASEGDPITTPAGADFLTMYSGSEHKEEAFEFIRWYTTEGIVLQEKYLPDYLGADLEDVITRLHDASPEVDIELVNMESLIHTLDVSEAAPVFIPPAFIGEVETAYRNEVERFLLEEQDLDATIENAHEAVQSVIDANVSE
ncbi:ABC transporter substrate-binding protein [Halalkalibacter sp. AB-rgal2]|uniref:ABC transporter substrate-binding protein n=1 Tax=Halalkalibacter sp. AB-rgal2 TaxID=3242695 RepID=UPI00359EB0CB